MLNPSTEAICRQYLNKELSSIGDQLGDLKQAKITVSVPHEPTKKQRTLFLAIESQERKLKARRKKLEAAIKDLKASVWHGNPEDLPCGSITTAVSYSLARR